MTLPPGRILAVDYGTKRVGIAVSDPLRTIARGLGTLKNTPDLLASICVLIAEHHVVHVVVGMPVRDDGTKSAMALTIERFIKALKANTAVPVEIRDESYTSVDAQRVFRSTGMRRKKRRQKERVDEMAARLLLQEYLDSHGG